MPIICDVDGLSRKLDRDDCGYMKFISSLLNGVPTGTGRIIIIFVR
jgi:hypothetical protein